MPNPSRTVSPLAAMATEVFSELNKPEPEASQKPILNSTPEPVKPDQPPDAPEWTFSLDFSDTRGRAWKGMFTTHILTEEEKRRAVVLRAKLLGGQPATAFTPDELAYWDAVAHLQTSLTNKPDWAKDLLAFDTPEVVNTIWAKVYAHIVRWFRLDADQSKSES